MKSKHLVMRPLDSLRDEHNLIQQYLDNLELAVEKLESDVRPPKEFFSMALQFSQLFLNTYHHYKEDHALFVCLAQLDDRELNRQVDALRRQHDMARNRLAGIRKALDGYAANEPVQTSELIENTAAYVSLLRNHIHKEDHIFYPLVEASLSEEQKKQIAIEFEGARRKVGADIFETSRRKVADMGSMLVDL